jgi:hypothetical protein
VYITDREEGIVSELLNIMQSDLYERDLSLSRERFHFDIEDKIGRLHRESLSTSWSKSVLCTRYCRKYDYEHIGLDDLYVLYAGFHYG